MEVKETLFVCLDCGFTDSDNRMFAHEECERKNNRVNKTMREMVEEKGFPDKPE